jgi:hypothetical protein
MHENTDSDIRDAVLLAGGVALIVLGAGLIVAHPFIRRTVLGSVGPLASPGNGIGGVLTDVERYLKLKAM